MGKRIFRKTLDNSLGKSPVAKFYELKHGKDNKVRGLVITVSCPFVTVPVGP